MKHQLTLCLVAIQFLTRLPVPHLDGFQLSWLSQSARYFPLVGVLVGVITVGVWWLGSLCFPPTVAVGLMLGASLLLTGAFHEDGFADTCDGFGGGMTRDAVLRIMKDSRIGAYGAIGITLMLGMKWATLVPLPRAAFPLVVVGASMVSRWYAMGLVWRLQYVRGDPDAKSKPVAESLDGVDWALSGAIGAVALLPVALLTPPATVVALVQVFVVAMVLAAVSACLAGVYFKSRIGGFTGDCLGATQQIAELTFLLTALGMLTSVQPG